MAGTSSTGRHGEPTSSARGDTGKRTANVYLVNLVVTARAELDAIPRPDGDDEGQLAAAMRTLVDYAESFQPHVAYRLLQCLRLIIQQITAGEAPPDEEPPSAVPG